MGQKRQLDLKFPTGGLNRRLAFQTQPPWTTPSCLNMRSFDTVAGRERGGSRPGLGKAYSQQLGSGAPVRLLAGVTVGLADPLQYSTDDFGGTAMGAAWSAASWKAGGLPLILNTSSSVTYGASETGAVHTLETFDATLPHTTEIYIAPYLGAHHGTYSLFMKLNDTTPLGTTDGLIVEFTITGSTGIYSGNVKAYNATALTTTPMTGGTDGTAEPGLLRAIYTPSTGALVVTWRGTTILASTVVSGGLGAGAGNRKGFGINCTVAGGVALVDYYRAAHQTTGGATVLTRYLVASAGGVLYRDSSTSGLEVVSSVQTLASDRSLQAAESNMKLYIADNGSSRVVKVYDPSANTLAVLTATAGSIPTDCPLICNYRNRIVLAGAPATPHVWYMSRQGTPTDWNYAADSTDGGRAVAGTSADAGTVGEAIIALIPHSDDFLIFACQNSMWILRGDPAFGGKIDNLARGIGVVDANAWCRGPEGTTIFLSNDGLYMLSPSSGYPVSLSRETLPEELIGIERSNFTPVLQYDPIERGVHIFLAAKAGGNSRNHYWMDWQTKTFWPLQLASAHEPFTILNHASASAVDSSVLLGGRDGYIRRFAGFNETDDGTAFSSNIWIGPIQPGGSGYQDGLLKELILSGAANSGDVAYAVYTGDSAEAAFNGSTRASGTFTLATRNRKARPNVRGVSLYVKLSNGESGRAWTFEELITIIERRGKQRL